MEERYSVGKSEYDQFLSIELQSALVNKHLAKVDKSSMANSIEARVPFLDHKLVEFTLGQSSEPKKTVNYC